MYGNLFIKSWNRSERTNLCDLTVLLSMILDGWLSPRVRESYRVSKPLSSCFSFLSRLSTRIDDWQPSWWFSFKARLAVWPLRVSDRSRGGSHQCSGSKISEIAFKVLGHLGDHTTSLHEKKKTQSKWSSLFPTSDFHPMRYWFVRSCFDTYHVSRFDLMYQRQVPQSKL